MDALKNFAPHAHWLLRLGLASVFLYHGSTKFGNLDGLSEMMGMPVAMIGILAAVEVGAAILILLGAVSKDWMTRLAGIALAVIMIGAIFMVHLEHGWNSVGNMGFEFQFTLMLTGLYFFLVGNGK